ncbi:MAG: GNAT family N-acetyltransferase/peptidase C39 family protein [Rhodospirillales bacterium]
MIRPATGGDLSALVDIEDRSFETDRFSRRTFRYLLSEANAATLVDVDGSGRIRGYAMVLFSRGTSLARLYSIAVAPEARSAGVGGQLMTAAEAAALDRDAAYMRLEVRADDPATQSFYAQRGYRRFAVQEQYYEDAAAAIRMEKSLLPRPDPKLIRVPFYAQRLDFTCGPAAVLMAMHALDPTVAMNLIAELRLWRESTTIFMTSGLGGCSPEGLALATHRRGFDVDLFLSEKGVMFIDSVRSKAKKEVIRLVQRDFRSQLRETTIPVVYRPLTLETMRAAFDAGGIPVVLISSYRIDREKSPHWVVVTGFDQRYVYLHDPSVDEEEGKKPIDCMQIPVLQSDFARMARYGRSQQKAALVIRKRSH